MRDHPLSASHALLGPHRGLASGWGHDPYALYAPRDHHAYHGVAWRDPDRAFDGWARRRPSVLRKLRHGYERAAFAAEFRRAFRRHVARHHRKLERAYDAGIDAGWSYGVYVAEELQYRRGYHQGFSERYVAAVRRSFDREYPVAWNHAHASAFDEWSRSVKPAIVGVRLIDGNDDGVFEPGEVIGVEYDVVNFGGGAGDVPVRLSGAALQYDAHAYVYLPARGTTSARLGEAAIRPTVRPRTHARLDFVVAGEREHLSVHVRRPVRFLPATLRLERDNLGGRLRVEIAVRTCPDVRSTMSPCTRPRPGSSRPAASRPSAPAQPCARRSTWMASPHSISSPGECRCVSRVTPAVSFRTTTGTTCGKWRPTCATTTCWSTSPRWPAAVRSHLPIWRSRGG